jgi:hypothetical protein
MEEGILTKIPKPSGKRIPRYTKRQLLKLRYKKLGLKQP